MLYRRQELVKNLYIGLIFKATQWINVHTSIFINFLVAIRSTVGFYMKDKSNAVL